MATTIGLTSYDELGDEHAHLIARVDVLETALRAIESHHVKLNERAGRDESRSTTLKLVRDALGTSSESAGS